MDSIRLAASSVAKVKVLDCESDSNHNRMVLTLVGPPEEVKDAVLLASRKAVELIDLTKHTGVHPRMGAVDVVPFVPLRNVTMEECVEIANSFAREFSRLCDVPVFLYERAARVPERANLAYVREGQFEGLRELIGKDPSRTPDYGPHKIHPTAGATAVGARPILIAYNVNLNTGDLSIAKKIASKIREKNGGLPSVKALGFELKERGLVQVSMNLTDYKRTSIHTAFEAVSKLARESGVEIVESEIVGLVPLESISLSSSYFLKLAKFDPNQIIENRLTKESTEYQGYADMSLTEFSDVLSSDSPTPGGGSASALAGSLAAALVCMVCKTSLGKRGYEQIQDRIKDVLDESVRLRLELLGLVDEDARSYDLVSKALRMPRGTDQEIEEREKSVISALRAATLVPAKTLELSYRVHSLAREIAEIGNRNARSDAESAIHLAIAANRGSLSNIHLNLESLSRKEKDGAFIESIKERIKPCTL